MTNKLVLDIITQERALLKTEATQVTVQTADGDITILPGHIPLLTQLKEGVLTYVQAGKPEDVAIFGGFLEIKDDGTVLVLADAAVRAEDIDMARVKAAQAEAQAKLRDKTKEQEFAVAEAALRRTYLEMKIANKKSKPRHSQN